jgi:DNA transformation protein
VDAAFVRELFSHFGPVDVRPMFGGFGIYADGRMFGLISEGAIYLKADAETTADFEREQSAPFSYKTKGGRRAVMSYWRLPDRLYDDSEELAKWAQRALATAVTGGLKKKQKGRRRAAA